MFLEKIKYKLLIKKENFIVYEIYLKNRKHYIGKAYFITKQGETIIKYNFSEDVFTGLIGSIMLVDLLDIGLYELEDINKSKIFVKNNNFIDCYDDYFQMDKEEINGMACYSKHKKR